MATLRAILVVILVKALRALSKDHSWGDPKEAPESDPEGDPGDGLEGDLGDGLEGDPEGNLETSTTGCERSCTISYFGVSLPRHLS